MDHIELARMGGIARALKLSKKRRSEIAKNAVAAREANKRKPPKHALRARRTFPETETVQGEGGGRKRGKEVLPLSPKPGSDTERPHATDEQKNKT